ncbi:uncharacterized protein LOC106162036 [Lingula anatina]|uniref:Uncharacterized protein LOC106162036 n=1 Tax=Lingula anatina TaxID=7574 RepID=A0A1S3I9R9_LINAN|nr:uncharacterized protein LOC106162036 [Lingula anatina]|eukprot:XP_013394601.1 uncharacterized protein LOC106162036 [Lingula anatina]
MASGTVQLIHHRLIPARTKQWHLYSFYFDSLLRLRAEVPNKKNVSFGVALPLFQYAEFEIVVFCAQRFPTVADHENLHSEAPYTVLDDELSVECDKHDCFGLESFYKRVAENRVAPVICLVTDVPDQEEQAVLQRAFHRLNREQQERLVFAIIDEDNKEDVARIMSRLCKPSRHHRFYTLGRGLLKQELTLTFLERINHHLTLLLREITATLNASERELVDIKNSRESIKSATDEMMVKLEQDKGRLVHEAHEWLSNVSARQFLTYARECRLKRGKDFVGQDPNVVFYMGIQDFRTQIVDYIFERVASAVTEEIFLAWKQTNLNTEKLKARVDPAFKEIIKFFAGTPDTLPSAYDTLLFTNLMDEIHKTLVDVKEGVLETFESMKYLFFGCPVNTDQFREPLAVRAKEKVDITAESIAVSLGDIFADKLNIHVAKTLENFQKREEALCCREDVYRIQREAQEIQYKLCEVIKQRSPGLRPGSYQSQVPDVVSSGVKTFNSVPPTAPPSVREVEMFSGGLKVYVEDEDKDYPDYGEAPDYGQRQMQSQSGHRSLSGTGTHYGQNHVRGKDGTLIDPKAGEDYDQYDAQQMRSAGNGLGRATGTVQDISQQQVSHQGSYGLYRGNDTGLDFGQQQLRDRGGLDSRWDIDDGPDISRQPVRHIGRGPSSKGSGISPDFGHQPMRSQGVSRTPDSGSNISQKQIRQGSRGSSPRNTQTEPDLDPQQFRHGGRGPSPRSTGTNEDFSQQQLRQGGRGPSPRGIEPEANVGQHHSRQSGRGPSPRGHETLPNQHKRNGSSGNSYFSSDKQPEYGLLDNY